MDALIVVSLEWEERRDFFPSMLIAQKANQGRQKHERLISAEQILQLRYKPKEAEQSEGDPDRGAQGDWRGLKAGLKDATRKAAGKRAKLKPVKHA